MERFFQTLESRTLFSGANPIVTAAYDQLSADVKVLRADFAADEKSFHTNSAAIAADIKALPKNKTNSLDVTKLNVAVAKALATDSLALARYVSVGTADVARAKADYLLEVKRPTTANQARLTAAVAALDTATAAREATFISDLGVGDQNIDAAMNVLVGANPTDTALQTDVNASESMQVTDVSGLEAQLTTVQNDVVALGNDVV